METENIENKVNNGDKPAKRKFLLYGFGILFIVILSFVGGLAAGTYTSVRNEILDSRGTVDIAKVINLYSKTRSEEVSFDQFWEVWNKVKRNYVDQPVSDVDLFYGAISGMVAALGDPHSVYFPPKEAEEFSKDLAGEFEGIGAEIGIKDNQLLIIAPLPGSPAEKAGLRAGDKVFAIDEEDTAGIKLDVAVSKIRGPRGTEVKLTVTHNGFDTVEDIVIVRDKINIPTVDWKMIEDTNIAYLHISYFNQDTWLDFDKSVREILRVAPKGIILDLRSNPGGFLETSIDIASEWVKQGIIVSEKNGDDYIVEHKSRGAHRLFAIPTVVMVDEGTASGSEIVAGALQDYGAAKIIGKKTFGKGSVQDFEVLLDGSGLKLTIAKWFTPKERKIDGEGIAPDIEIEEMFEPVRADVPNEKGEFDIVEVKDKGLEKALDILN